MTLRHGIRVPTVGKPQETGDYAAEVESLGFDFMWIPDTPVLAGRWRDVYVHLTCAALRTSRLTLGPGVTNPLTRHPVATASAMLSLDEVSDGRAELLAGTGYSSAYIIGRRAATLAQMRSSTELWRGIFSGRRTDLGGLEIELDTPRPLPIYLAASGPRMLQLAGEIADGVLIMVGAAPGAVAWAIEQVEAGMQRAGRRRDEVKRLLVVTACIDEDRGRAIELMRPCAASLYRHRAVDVLLERAGLDAPDEVPAGRPQPYPDLHHAVRWDEAREASRFVPDDAVEAMVALGPPAEVAERARALAALDVDAIWWRDEQSYARPDRLMRALAGAVLPEL